MKKLLYLFISTSIFLASCSKDCATPEPQEEWLFVHTAVSAQILNATTIEMPVTNKILAFTDRPFRKQYYMTAQQYADLWTHSGENCFQEDPPNAVLTWVDGEEMKEVEVVITHAVSDSSTIIYTINDTSGVIAGDIMNASLFVDGQNSLLEIGDTYGGGIVFYLDENNGGLISAPSDQAANGGNNSPYYLGLLKDGVKFMGDGWNKALGTAIGTGQKNTEEINAFVGAGDVGYGGSAAKVCTDLKIGIYDDWYLPSKDELNLMYLNIGPGNALGLGNIGHFNEINNSQGYFYWSSSNIDIYEAWVQFFRKNEYAAWPAGDQQEWAKSEYGCVRAIRHFWFSPYSYE